MKQFTTYILLVTILIASVGCSREEEMQAKLPFSLCLPVDDAMRVARMPGIKKVMGDPGSTEGFLFPNHIYIIVMKKDGDNWVRWNSIEKTLTDEDWIKTRYSGVLQTVGDSIFLYNGQFNLLLSNEQFEGRVYAMASAEPLTFNQAINTVANLSEVENLTFSVSTTTIQKNLQHIYTTPYNYKVSGDYYGSFNSAEQRVPHLSLLLYHVAAKVDITWNVDEDKRINKETPASGLRLTYMEAQHLFNGNAYCFKPLRNQMATKESIGYSIPNMVTADDEGLWWEGRSYFYTIPYVASDVTSGDKVYFPLQLLMRTNGSAGDGYRPTLNMKIDTTEAVFVPWLRANVNISAPFTDKAETKTVDD